MHLWNLSQFTTVIKVCNMFLILMDLTRFCWVLCDWSFQVLGVILMDKGIRSSKSLSLGMSKAPKGNILKETQASKLGDAPEGIPSFISNLLVCHFELYFYSSHDMCFAWSVMCYILLFLYFSTIIVAGHTYLREIHLHHNFLEYSMCFTYIFWA